MADWERFKTAVKAYKYTSPTLSLLERLFLNNFWAQVAELYPRWLAPNVITLMGYACVWAAFAITMYGSPRLMGELDSLAYFASAALFFLYQTLDGSDGKQARRTGSGSALGELMDHGVDAVVTTLLALIVSDVFQFGILSVWPWCFVSVALLSFFLSNLTLVHSGRQMFFDLDVMEIQTVMILTLILAGAFGPQVFNSINLPLPAVLHTVKTDLWGILKPDEQVDFTSGTVSLKLFIVLGGLAGIVFNYPQYLWAAAKPYVWLKKEDWPEHLKNKVPGSGLCALLSHLVLIHVFFALCVLSVVLGTNLATSERSEAAMRSFAVLVAFSFGDIMDRVLLMRVAQEPLPAVPSGFFPLIAFVLCALQDAAFIDFEARVPVAATVKWWRVLTVASFVIHQTYFARSVIRLARALGIHPFKLLPQKQD